MSISTDPSTDRPSSPPSTSRPGLESAASDGLDLLVSRWLTFDEAAAELGLGATKVRQLVRDGQLCAVRTQGASQPRIPAELLSDGGTIVKGLPGTLTLLHDAGYDEAETVQWLFTADDSLPGRPVDALREDRGTEVRRRAQALGF
ncbi:MAG: Rv2175c family DNA-binding protein [Nocardioidaceae bacterium]